VDFIADRFFVLNDGRTIDLASGREVTLVTSSAGGASEQVRWAERCERFFRLRHRAIANLVDFGVFAEMRRFEAWDCGGLWKGASSRTAFLQRAASLFLSSSGLSAGLLDSGALHVRDNQPVVLPSAECGYALDAADRRPDAAGVVRAALALEHCATTIITRRAVAIASEIFSQPSGGHPRALALWGAPGVGVTTAIQDLSRVARLNGFVPVHLSAVERLAGARCGLLERSLCVIAGDHPVEGWRGMARWLLRNPRPHILVFAGRREIAHVDGLQLEPLSAEALVNLVQPRCVDAATRSRIERAAERAHGIPGRFVQLLWGGHQELPRILRHHMRTRAAEHSEAYGDDDVPSEDTASASVPWVATGELVTLRSRLDGAVGLLERGRLAPGGRALRQAIGSLARRRDWTYAARGQLALAGGLLRRGRPREAQAALAGAREWVGRTDRDSPLWVEEAILAGVAWTDLAQLEDAENVLQGAIASARAVCDRVRMAAAHLALARCLFWKGRHHEGAQVLAAIDCTDREQESLTSIRVAILASRLAVGRGDGGAAVSRASAALEAAHRLAQPAAIAHASYAAAFAHLAVGDRIAMERDIAACVQASRSAHDPLRAFRARLLGAEHACRLGPPRTPPAILRRMANIPAASIPATVRARCAVLGDLASSSASAADIVNRHVAATGLQALVLFAPGVAAGSDGTDPGTIRDILEILGCCQSAEDGPAVLNTVVGRLRRQLHATAIACISPDGGLLASDGCRIESRIAERVLAAGQAIAPHLCDGSIEGGAPVRYGGEPIAALVGRWGLGTRHDWSRAAMAITLAATAAGPAVAEVLSRRREGVVRALGEILGVSPAMADVRRSVERAAAAPFAVLIEGESGSGKELVARALHRQGPRRDRPFCTINCAALPDDLVESELFGHARGAFTGAVVERPGVFEEAHTGTLFLDEIGELSPRAQAKVLRTIQEGEIRRVGENVARRVDVRIVAATNRDLQQESAAGRFRVDLLYRLDVVRITVPALRERREDVALLAERFWLEATARVNSRATLGSATLAALARYDWPGNVRELQNVLAALAVRSPKRGVVPPTALPPPFTVPAPVETWRLDHARRMFEERFVRAALVRTAGHRLRAAEQLGVTRQGLTKLMTRLGIAE